MWRATIAIAGWCAMTGAAQQALDNDAIVKLVKAGLGEDTVVAMINTQPGNYVVDADSAIRLKSDGVTDKEIAAMITKQSSGPAVPGVDSPGIYYKNNNAWEPMQSEAVAIKTSSNTLAMIATQGMAGGPKMKSRIAGKSSALTLSMPLDLMVFVPEGTAPSEYRLMELKVSGDSREVHTEKPKKETWEVKYNKIGPHIYEMTVSGEVKPGEYGFTPPGPMGSGMMGGPMKLYSFHIN
jgi:hypothetical protein